MADEPEPQPIPTRRRYRISAELRRDLIVLLLASVIGSLASFFTTRATFDHEERMEADRARRDRLDSLIVSVTELIDAPSDGAAKKRWSGSLFSRGSTSRMRSQTFILTRSMRCTHIPKPWRVVG
jgi:hypothetical protein